MTTAEIILVCVLSVIGVVGGIIGAAAFLKTMSSVCHGSVSFEGLVSDDDLQPHPRFRRQH